MLKGVYDIKKNNKLVGIFILFILAFGAVTYLLDLYPGGYRLDYSDTKSITIKENGIIHSEQYKILQTEGNELKIALLEAEIAFLKGFWFISITLFSALLLNVFTLQKIFDKKKQYALIASSLLVSLLVIVIIVYMKSLNFIEKIISELII